MKDRDQVAEVHRSAYLSTVRDGIVDLLTSSSVPNSKIFCQSLNPFSDKAKDSATAEKVLLLLEWKSSAVANLTIFAAEQEISHSEVKRIYFELIRFLVLVHCHPREILTPSKKVGALWLHMDQDPNFDLSLAEILEIPEICLDELDPDLIEVARKQYQTTLDCYWRLFDQRPTDLWPENGPALMQATLYEDI